MHATAAYWKTMLLPLNDDGVVPHVGGGGCMTQIAAANIHVLS